MTVTAVRFALLILMSLLVGTMFGIWAGFDPQALSASAYVEQQQNAIRSLNTLLPAIGALCILLAAALAYLCRRDKTRRHLLLGTVVLLLVSAVVTRFANQPINATVMTWSPQSPPDGWAQLRDQWWQWHQLRTVAGIAALALAVLAAIQRGSGASRDQA